MSHVPCSDEFLLNVWYQIKKREKRKEKKKKRKKKERQVLFLFHLLERSTF